MTPVLECAPSSAYPVPSSNWQQDPETGYLYISDTARGSMNPFNVEVKKEFVAQYRARFPALNDCLDQVGISRNTFYWHMKFDTRFREDIQDIKEHKMDVLECAMFQVASQPKSSSFMDRIAMLRAHRPDIYTEKRINLTGKDLEPSTLAHKAGHLGQVVDAELCQVQEPGIQLPRSVTVSQEDSKISPEPGQKETPKPVS